MAAKKTTTAKGNAVKKPIAQATPQIVIEDNVPIPQVPQGKGVNAYIGMLKVGQSFLVPASDEADAKKKRTNLMASARRLSKQGVKNFTVLIVPEEQGVRVWRTDDDEQEEKMDNPYPQQQVPAPTPGQSTAVTPPPLMPSGDGWPTS
jgi:hypothetical protein